MKQFNFFVLALMTALTTHAQNLDKVVPDEIIVYKTIDDAELGLHVFNPEDHQTSDQRPAIIFFHGGGWYSGSPTQFYPHSAYLSSRGIVAISATYRVRKRNGTSPVESVKDAKSAIRWVRQHADQLGIDPEKIIAGDGSAGGHIAAATGTTEHFEEEGEDLSVSSRPAALVLFNPVFDNGPDGYGHDRVKAYWKDFSPLHNINKTTPPTIVFLGTEDKHVAVSSAE